MRSRRLLLTCAAALVATSCSQAEPHVLSEAPRSSAATDVTSSSQSTDPASKPGRFVARCATEAEGGTPGATVFTDGSEGVTDHCLSRYYIGVQPQPGAVYVPDDEAGTYAPSRTSGGQGNATWTPAQPRTDTGPQQTLLDRETAPDQAVRETQNGGTTPVPDAEGTLPTSPVTSPGEPSPTGQQPTTPGEPGTQPTEPTGPGTVPPEGETPPPTDSAGSTGSESSGPPVPTTTVQPGPGTSLPLETSVTATAAPGGPGIGALEAQSGTEPVTVPTS